MYYYYLSLSLKSPIYTLTSDRHTHAHTSVVVVVVIVVAVSIINFLTPTQHILSIDCYVRLFSLVVVVASKYCLVWIQYIVCHFFYQPHKNCCYYVYQEAMTFFCFGTQVDLVQALFVRFVIDP